MQEQIVQDIDFGKLGGIVPVVVQDAKSRQVLMVAFMNEEAFSRTVGSGFMWYFSRKRKTLWKKGEQSGHVQIVKAIYLDCDNDTILAEVEQVGGACDLGYRSCFDKKWHDDSFVVDGGAAQVFDPSAAYAAYAEDIRLAVPTGSLERCTRELLGFALENGTSTDGEFFRGALPAHSGTAVFFGHNPRDIPALIASGEYDAGITGFDIALEAGTSVVPIANLGYNKRGQGAALWAVAVPDSSPATRIHDLEGATVVSDLTAVTAEFFRRHGLSITVRPRPDGDHAEFFVGDPVVELIETGATRCSAFHTGRSRGSSSRTRSLSPTPLHMVTLGSDGGSRRSRRPSRSPCLDFQWPTANSSRSPTNHLPMTLPSWPGKLIGEPGSPATAAVSPRRCRRTPSRRRA